MKIMIVSKALVIAAYRRKLPALSRLGLDVVAVVPPEWKEGGGRQSVEEANDAGYRLIVTPIHWNGHFHLHYYPQLPRLVREQKPDLLHMDEEPYNLATFGGVLAAQRAGVPSLFFTWQNLLRRYPPPFSVSERYVYRNVNGAIAGSQEAVEVLRAKGFRGSIAAVPQFGVDTEVFRPGERPPGPFTVGFLNRLIEGKAPLLAIDAFKMLPPDAQLRIVGDGSLRSQVAAAIADPALAGRVQLDGRLPSLSMPRLLAGLDVVILPSITTPSWKEQFGRIVIEAMACGVPVVGSDSGEIPNVIGDAGIIVPEGDASALGAALLRLHGDPRLRERLAEQGRERVLKWFSNVSIAARTAEAYRRFLTP